MARGTRTRRSSREHLQQRSVTFADDNFYATYWSRLYEKTAKLYVFLLWSAFCNFMWLDTTSPRVEQALTGWLMDYDDAIMRIMMDYDEPEPEPEPEPDPPPPSAPPDRPAPAATTTPQHADSNRDGASRHTKHAPAQGQAQDSEQHPVSPHPITLTGFGGWAGSSQNSHCETTTPYNSGCLSDLCIGAWIQAVAAH